MRRTQRQTLIDGWSQKKLDEGLFLNLGTGYTAEYAALLASCLEFGKILTISDKMEEGRFMGRHYSGNKAEGISKILQSMNPAVGIEGFANDLRCTLVKKICHYRSPIVLHSSNDWDEKRYLLANLVHIPGRRDDSGEEMRREFLLTAGDDHQMRLSHYDYKEISPNHLMPQFSGIEGRIIGMGAASMAMLEIIGKMFRRSERLEDIITWNLRSDQRTYHVDDFSWDHRRLEGRKIALIGCGAVGAMYLELIHDLGFSTVYNWDPDQWENTNFARVPQCIGYAGRPKARTLARHYNARKTGTSIIPRNWSFREDSYLPPVDLLVCAADGFHNQIAAVNYSQRRGIPLILGGCSEFSCNIYAYSPGMTSSLLLQYDFLKSAYLSSIRERHPHCTDQQVHGSQALITALCAAFMAGETVNLFNDKPLRGPFGYDIRDPGRLSYYPLKEIKDLGNEIPVFQPPDKKRVQRQVHPEEKISVDAMPFNEWYEKTDWVMKNGG